jgi:hypothetical protein
VPDLLKRRSGKGWSRKKQSESDWPKLNESDLSSKLKNKG